MRDYRDRDTRDASTLTFRGRPVCLQPRVVGRSRDHDRAAETKRNETRPSLRNGNRNGTRNGDRNRNGNGIGAYAMCNL